MESKCGLYIVVYVGISCLLIAANWLVAPQRVIQDEQHVTLQNTSLASFPAPCHHALIIRKKGKSKSKAAGSIAGINKRGQETNPSCN
ncbi:unnamed protein product [Musa hybrid cultivar]